MNIRSIITNRRAYGYYYNQIVYEWEDVFKEILGLSFSYNTHLQDMRFIRRMGLSDFLTTSSNSLCYDMHTYDWYGHNKKNIVPIIIDFYRQKQELDDFYLNYKNNPIVLISSHEAYQFLLEQKCPLKIGHLGLSISDKYKITEDCHFEKQFDAIMIGRPNAILQKYLDKYKNTHPDFKYVFNVRNGNNNNYYTSDGILVSTLRNRNDYLNLLRKAKIGLYSTPGIDNGLEQVNGYNQVTPRFLEYLICGCHVIARYKQNPDTDWYEFNKYWPSIERYEQFEYQMDKMRHEEMDMCFLSNYLKKHYTSVRVEQLQTILNTI